MALACSYRRGEERAIARCLRTCGGHSFDIALGLLVAGVLSHRVHEWRVAGLACCTGHKREMDASVAPIASNARFFMSASLFRTLTTALSCTRPSLLSTRGTSLTRIRIPLFSSERVPYTTRQLVTTSTTPTMPPKRAAPKRKAASPSPEPSTESHFDSRSEAPSQEEDTEPAPKKRKTAAKPKAAAPAKPKAKGKGKAAAKDEGAGVEGAQPTNKVMPVDLKFPAKQEGTVRIATWNICGLAAAQKKVRCARTGKDCFRAQNAEPLRRGLRFFGALTGCGVAGLQVLR